MSDNPEQLSNYLRIVRLVVDFGTKTARDIFYHFKPRSNVPSFFGSTTIRSEIVDLKWRRVITETQYMKLISNPDPDEFDLCLILTLLTNIFTGMIDPPRNGWDRPLDKTDFSLGADLIRLREIRNSTIGHSVNARIDSGDFEKLWNQIEVVLLRLNKHILGNDEHDINVLLEKYKTICLDPCQLDEENYIDTLQHWCKGLKEEVDDLWEKTKDIEAMAKLKNILEISTIWEFISKMNVDCMCAILNDLRSVIYEDEKIRDYRTRTGGEKLLQNPSYNIQKMFMSCLHEMPESENILLCLQDFFIDEDTEHSKQLQRMLKNNKNNIKSLYIDTSRTSRSLREIIDLFSLSDLSHIQKLYYRGDWKDNAEINLMLFPSLQSVTLFDSEWTNDKENLSEKFARLQNLQYLYMFNFTMSHKILETFFKFISGQKSMKELTLYLLNCKKHGRHDCKRWNLDFSKHSTLTKVNLKMLPTLQLDIKTPSLVYITLLDINLDKSSLLLSGEMLNIKRVKLFVIAMSAGSLQNFITVLENLPQSVTVTMDDIEPETEYKRVKENIRRSQTFHVIEDDILPGAFEFKTKKSSKE